MDRKKIVIRKLPPNIPEEDVRQLVQTASSGHFSWFSFVQGKTSVKKVVSSRCYVCLDNPTDIPAFKAAVEKQVFVTDRGAQFRGSVEFAPFQGVPPGKVKRDLREGSLHKDPEYLAFVERLNAAPKPESKPEAPAAAAKGQDKPVTALMAFLQEQHARKRQGAAVAVRSRRDRHKESRAQPVRTIVMDADRDDPDDYKRSGALLAAGSARKQEQEPGKALSVAPDRRAAKSRQDASRDQAKQGADGSSAADCTVRQAPKDAKPERIKAGFQVYEPGRSRRPGRPSETPANKEASSGQDSHQQTKTARQK